MDGDNQEKGQKQVRFVNFYPPCDPCTDPHPWRTTSWLTESLAAHHARPGAIAIAVRVEFAVLGSKWDKGVADVCNAESPVIIFDAQLKASATQQFGADATGSLEKATKSWFSQLLRTISGILSKNECGTFRFVLIAFAAMEGAMHDSRTVANRFLELARATGDCLTPMQVLKLVYIAHGWMLGLYGRALIKDRVEAWQYGPVIPALYNAMRDYRGAPVTVPVKAPSDDILDGNEDDIVRQVYEIYGKKTGPALSRLTHATGTPWHMTYVPGEFGLTIPTDIIEDHYQRLAAK